jgi:hypothetical protein
MCDDYACPCCGIDLQVCFGINQVCDGDELACGCAGWWSVDAESAHIIISDEEECPPDALCQEE